MKTVVRAAFDLAGVTLPLTSIHPIRQVKPSDHAFGKYKAVVSSIREVGVIEPLIVHPQRGSRGTYLLLDGHMRLKALQELGRTEAFCLIAKDDDAFTYNDKVSRLSLIQEHAMIVRAIDQGVTADQISKALSIDIAKVRSSLNLLDGIDADAVELLKDKPITASSLRLYRKAKPISWSAEITTPGRMPRLSSSGPQPTSLSAAPSERKPMAFPKKRFPGWKRKWRCWNGTTGFIRTSSAKIRCT
jgi:hypothetical protein